ncbi:Alpha/Beta hydrolase protein [Mycena sanguinolenta]|nr:Alpha/Beta hydrolase protein [Mycena sanguinolenta]
MPITPQDVANADLISGLSLSASGDRVVYCVGPTFHKDMNKTQALWLAAVGVAESARKITSGLFNDQNPKFHPTSGDVFFLSDRHKAGSKPQLYRLSSREFGGDPGPLTPTENIRGVSSFEISPDGRWLAYISADEPADKDEEKQDTYVIIWRAQKEIGRLRIIDLSESKPWFPTQILYRLTKFPGLESEVLPISENIASIQEDGVRLLFNSTHVVTHNPLLFSGSVWTEPGIFHFLHTEDYASAPALWTCGTEPGASPTRVAFGETDDAVRLVVSGVTGEAENIWSGSTTPGTKGVLSAKLSSHHEWTLAKEMPQCTPFYWSADDGTALEGVAAYPRGQLPNNLPTIVVPHGGPYGRDTVNLRIVYPNQNYRYLLASYGFLVLSPNYRGSQGRGNDFARTSKGGMGTLDYADVESMLEAAVGRGYADRDKVAIAGWSHGGFLSAWACTRPNSIWKTAIITSGLTDWGSMAICTDVPAAEASLFIIFVGSAPWTPRHDPQEVPQYLKGCPMADVKNVMVPVLVIHGEKDERVPVTQAIGFMRGLESEADKAVSSASTFLVYPKEGHVFEERAHVEDHLTRVLAHMQKYLA